MDTQLDDGPAPAPPPSSQPRRRRVRLSLRWLRRPVVGTVAEAGGVGVIAVGIASLLYRVWDASLSVPIWNSGDTVQLMAVIKGIADNGWYLHNPNLGAPFGTQFYDFPNAGETLQLAIVRFLSLFTHRPGVIMNVYYFLGFGALAAVTYLVFRHLRFQRLVAAPLALLYTFLPYHFWHAEGHLWRSAYVSAPIGALLILWVLTWRSRFLHDPDGGLRGWHRFRANVRWTRVLGAAVLAVLLALIETMTFAFVMVALVVACVLVALRDRDPGVLVAGAGVVAVAFVVFLVAMAPNLWYWHTHGKNSVAARRYPAEQEYYGLQLSQMVLPLADHRGPAALGNANLRARERSVVTPGNEGGQELGFIGAIGFLVALYGGLKYAFRPGRLSRTDEREQLWGHAGMLTMVLVVFGVVSGLALIMSLYGFAQIRAWNRVVVLIAFFALVVVAIGLERLLAWFRGRLRRPWLALAAGGAVSVLLVLFGLWDAAIPIRPAYSTTTHQAQIIQKFVADLEHRLPSGAAIFQLPVVRFPEYPPVANLHDNDELFPYEFSHDLRWSYGGMKGRPEADWQLKVDSNDPAPRLAGLRGLGFDGIVLFTQGYADGGTAVSRQLSKALGQPEVTSDDGAMVFWDLRDYAARNDRTPEQMRRAARKLVGDLIDQIPVQY